MGEYDTSKVCKKLFSSKVPGVLLSVPEDHHLTCPQTELAHPVPLGVGSHSLNHCADFAFEERHIHTTENGIKKEISFLYFLLFIFF